jgi:CRP-like cAMP-binding protein
MGCPCDNLADSVAGVATSCIGNLWLFENLAPKDLEAIVERAIRKKYEPGQRIFFQGDPARELFLVKAGRVKLTKNTAEGGEITLDIRKPGDLLGENILNEDIDYPVSASCIETAFTCGFTRPAFEKLVLDHPRVGLQVIKNMSRRIDSLTRRIGGMSLTTLEERLYNVLVNVAKEHGTPSRKGLKIQFPLTHEEMSYLVGAHRVSITRALKTLKEDGRVIQEGRWLIVYPVEVV